ncbi:SubName: Full=Uncharacterized protein {ECO:0000313/EMBL:CCA74093.1} [Serendipita indica DSM 11827]|nr:SubName: Full=Uncharacterized protein {ECO:0000313/EMBL:CCA74093.1} [Serendipita indica DSM 11827]
MYNIFPLVRGALLGTVGAWTFIVLGIAIHFQMSFVDSAPQLTYVSLSVFVAAVTLATFLVVAIAPFALKGRWAGAGSGWLGHDSKRFWLPPKPHRLLYWLRRVIAKSRISSEQSGNSHGSACLLFFGRHWLDTTTPAAKDNEVECWEEDEEGVVVDSNVEGYSNSVYHARYRVLQAFAFFNCILRDLFPLFVHSRSRILASQTWPVCHLDDPTTSVGWFDGPTRRGHLPPPISHRNSHKDKKRSYEKWDDEKEKGSGHKKAFKFDAASISERVRDTVKDKMPSKDRRRAKDTSDIDEFGERKDLIAKPPPVARANTTPLKPRQYMVSTSGETKAKPPLAPIAAKMTERKEERGNTEPKRQPSQRERAEIARQQARRERNTTDDERPSRPAVRQNSSRGQRSGSAQPATRVRRETSTTRAPDVRRQPSQTRATPDLTRSGSGADRGRSSAQGQGRAQRSESNTRRTTDDERYQSRNPYRPANGRRV